MRYSQNGATVAASNFDRDGLKENIDIATSFGRSAHKHRPDQRFVSNSNVRTTGLE
jgi:hypothetical protein